MMSSLLIACTSETASTFSEVEEESFTFTFSSAFSPISNEYEPKYYGIDLFAEEVEKRSEGRIQFDIYYSNQLVPQGNLLDAIASGTIDMGGHGSYWGDMIPTNDVFWLPYISDGEEELMHLVRDTEVGEIFEQNLEEYGVKPLFYWPSSANSFMTNQEIRVPEDLNGTMMRLPTGLWLTWFQELGIAPANVAASEIYEALQRGTMDGTIYPYYTLDTNNYHEVVDYATYPPVIDPVMTFTTISLDKWNTLPEDLQQIMLDVGEEMEGKAIEASKAQTKDSLQIAEEKDVTVTHFSDEEWQRFRDSSDVVWDEFASISDDTKRMVEVIREELPLEE